MTPLQVYQYYISLRKHFADPEYNIDENNLLYINPNVFVKNNGRFKAGSLSKHSDPVGVFISYYIETGTFPKWIGDIVDDHYNPWKKRIDSLSYELKNYLTKIEEPVILLFKVKEASTPKIILDFFEDKISPELFVIIIHLTGLKSYYDDRLKDDSLWKQARVIYNRYYPLISTRYDRKLLADLLVSVFPNDKKD